MTSNLRYKRDIALMLYHISLMPEKDVLSMSAMFNIALKDMHRLIKLGKQLTLIDQDLKTINTGNIPK